MLAQSCKAPITRGALWLVLLGVLSFASVANAEDPPHYVTEWGIQGSAPEQLDDPADMVLDHQNRLVFADTGNHRIKRFDRDGNYLDGWGGLGSGPGQLHSPLAVGIAPNSDIFVVDRGNSRIVRFSDSGAFIEMWGVEGIEPGEVVALHQSERRARDFKCARIRCHGAAHCPRQCGFASAQIAIQSDDVARTREEGELSAKRFGCAGICKV